MAELTTIARPYAKAVFELAVSNDQLAQWGETLALVDALASHEQLEPLLSSPLFDAQLIADVIIDAAGKQLSAQGANLVRVLAANRRLNLIADVHVLFLQLRAEHEKTVKVEVRSALPLSKAQEQALVKALEKRLQAQVKLDASVDKELLGGVVVRAGDLVIDGSLRGKLARLSTTLLA